MVLPSWANLANFFTFTRIVLTPFVVEAILTSHPIRAMALFALAAVTDIFDGVAARKLGVATSTGAYFDPIADKLLLSAVFLALAGAKWIPWWLVVLALGRDLYILLAVAVLMLLTPIRKFPPSLWGKLSTFVQICTVVVWMARNCLESPPVNALASGMIWICAAVTVWSGIHYTWRGIQLVRAH